MLMSKNKHSFNLKRELDKMAMGADWQVYRTPLEWFKYEEIVDGQNEEWNNWTQTTPSLENALVSIGHRRNQLMTTFINRYGLSANEVKNMFYTLVGYAPQYGAYSLSIGPYDGPKEEGQNRFGYFVQRYGSATEEEIIEALNIKIKKYWQEWSDILRPEDFQLVVDKVTNEKKAEGGKNWKHEQDVYSSLDMQNSVEAQTLFQTCPVMCPGSKIEPNAKGLMKMMVSSANSGNWSDLLNQAMQKVVQKQGLDPAMLEAWKNDASFVKSTMKELESLGKELVATGVIPEGALPIPDMKKFKFGETTNADGTKKISVKSVVVGAQRDTCLQTSVALKAHMELKTQILQTINELGTDDPEQVAQGIQQLRAGAANKNIKATGQINAERMAIWIQELQSDRVIRDTQGNVAGQKDYAQLLSESQVAMEDLLLGRGYGDFETAVKTACLYYADVGLEDVDPRTRAKLTVSISNPPALSGIPDEIPQITEQQLTQWRNSKTEADAALESAGESDLEEDIGEEVDGVDGVDVTDGTDGTEGFDIVDTPSVQPETTQPSPVEPVQTQEEEEEDEDNLPDYYPRFDNLMSKTIVRLIRLAEELDKEGKEVASEEIHKVIRKHYKGLK